MRLPGFHAFAWDGPGQVLHVELNPAGPDDFSGAGGGEDLELERDRSEACLLPELLKEGRSFGVGQSGTRLMRFQLAGCGQQVVQVPAPACRIVTAAVLPNGGPVQNRLDPLTEPGGRLGLAGPDRLKRLEHVGVVDLGNGAREQGGCVGV
jgi:hypothetical protein